MVACPRSGTLEVHKRPLAIQNIADRGINGYCVDRIVFLLEMAGQFYLGRSEGPMKAWQESQATIPHDTVFYLGIHSFAVLELFNIPPSVHEDVLNLPGVFTHPHFQFHF